MAPETPRAVSSRLLTMKFMQRAAASASTSESPDGEASRKKRKRDSSPEQGRINTQIDQALIKAALDDQEATRQAALEKHASADTHWTMEHTWNVKKSANPTTSNLNVVYVGYGDLDSSSESCYNESRPSRGRTSSKPVKRKEPEVESTDDESESQSSDGDEIHRKRKDRHDSDDADSPSSKKRSHSRSRSVRDGESGRAKEFRDKRKEKEIRLNQLTSISAGGRKPSGSRNLSSGGSTARTCYKCRQAGHKAADCPKAMRA